MHQLQEQLSRAETVVGRVLFAVRTALTSAAGTKGATGTNLGGLGSDGGTGVAGNMSTSLRLLEVRA